MKKRIFTFPLLIFSIFSIACLISCREQPAEPLDLYEYQVPRETNDGWQTAGLDAVGINKEILTGLVNDIYDEKYEDIHGILIVTEYEWNFITPDILFSSGDLKLRPRDMAKFGFLYLNGGNYINPDPVDEIITQYILPAIE